MSIESSLIPKRRRVAVYARVSSSQQIDDGTIESQINVLVEHARNQNFELPDGWIFQDNGVSGYIMQRPALDALRDLVASGSPDLLLIYHPDRLARKYVYQALLLEEFAKCGVEVIFYKNKKAETPEEHLLEQFQGVFAEYERAQITERCRRGKLYKAKQQSVSVIPNAPYGYRYVRDRDGGPARYELHKEESETVLRLFQMYAEEGKSLVDLCSFMDKSGKAPRRSILGWDRETIRSMLRNRAYMGLAGFGKTEKHEGNMQRIVRGPKNGRILVSKDARRERPEDEWITIPVPAIVSEDLYWFVQEKLGETQKFALRNTKQPSILQGILVCDKCRGSYYKKVRSNRHAYYSCHRTLKKSEISCDNRSIRQHDLDDYVWRWIIALLRDPELVKAEIQRRSTESSENKSVLKRKMDLSRERNKLATSRNKLLDAYSEGECLSLEELKKRMRILNQHAQQVERELAIIETQMSDEGKIIQSQLTLSKFAESLEDSSTVLSVEEKQRVVRALIDEIVIHEDHITIKHCIPMANHPVARNQKCPLHGNRYQRGKPSGLPFKWSLVNGLDFLK